MTPEDVRAVAQELRDHATHFEPRDWRYTRDLGDLVALRYGNDPSLWRRVKQAMRYLTGRHGLNLAGLSVSRWAMIRVSLERDPRLPDGVLDGGCILTHWEETGEYLQYVQPTVGAMIAEWLTAEPDNPHAVRVATEMRRIQDDYAERLRGSA